MADYDMNVGVFMGEWHYVKCHWLMAILTAQVSEWGGCFGEWMDK